jgi:FixJ family two-component response regulator
MHGLGQFQAAFVHPDLSAMTPTGSALMRMPELSGTQLATRVRELRPGVPVVIASGYGGPELRNRARNAGVYQVLEKPWESYVIARRGQRR